ncbi:unnamed protein product [Diabrotica balteata]|uniref:Uncharacterized protein n=1 Tax=Diabrotica balteata TaxID=107213 RepID=A0A9N9XGE1_DIABA|nr:unnamed protein product [Diabrotica balteata]
MNTKLDETLTHTKCIYENIISSIHQTAQEVLGIKQNKISNKFWWNEDVKNAVTEKKRLYHKWLNTKDDADKERYNEMKKKTRKIIMTSKNETWDRRCREIESLLEDDNALRRGSLETLLRS